MKCGVRFAAIAAVASVALVVPTSMSSSLAAPGASGDWRQTGFNVANTKFNKAERTITTANVHELVAGWNIPDAAAGSPAVVGSHIYAQGTTAVTARNIATGAVEWSFPLASESYAATVAVVDGVVYAKGKAVSPATVYAIDAATGAQRWKLNVQGFAGRDITVAEGLLFVGDFAGALIAVDTATHKVKWTFTSGDTVDQPAVAGGHVYVSSLDHNVYSLDETTGKVEWHFDTGEEISDGPSVAKGIVYVGVRHGVEYAINASDGSFRWKYETGALYGGGVAVGEGRGLLRGARRIHVLVECQDRRVPLEVQDREADHHRSHRCQRRGLHQLVRQEHLRVQRQDRREVVDLPGRFEPVGQRRRLERRLVRRIPHRPPAHVRPARLSAFSEAARGCGRR